jgi:5-formyltetrahydrofolate cyclo-ligase
LGTENSVSLRKQGQRAALSQQLLLVTDSERRALNQRLIDFLKAQKGVWAAFFPIQGEPQIDEVIRQSTHLEWVYPRIEGADLSFRSLGHGTQKGPLGLIEPTTENPCFDPALLGGVLVPGLGFDHQGVRLGRGKGFYDRALLRVNGLCVGLCFERQRVLELPHEEHDVRMDRVLTDQNLWVPSGLQSQRVQKK